MSCPPLRTAVALLLVTAACGYGQLTVAIDLDPGTAGIQATRVASVGDIVTAQIMFIVGAAGLSSYGISILFDSSELNLNGSPAATELLPVGFTFNLTPGVAEESNMTLGMPGFGHVYTFEAGTFGAGPTGSTFAIGTISFRVTSVFNDGVVDITPGFFNLGIDGAFDNAGTPITPTFMSGSIVPEPATIGYLTLGFGAFLCQSWARNRRRGRSLNRES